MLAVSFLSTPLISSPFAPLKPTFYKHIDMLKNYKLEIINFNESLNIQCTWSKNGRTIKYMPQMFKLAVNYFKK